MNFISVTCIFARTARATPLSKEQRLFVDGFIHTIGNVLQAAKVPGYCFRDAAHNVADPKHYLSTLLSQALLEAGLEEGSNEAELIRKIERVARQEFVYANAGLAPVIMN